MERWGPQPGGGHGGTWPDSWVRPPWGLVSPSGHRGAGGWHQAGLLSLPGRVTLHAIHEGIPRCLPLQRAQWVSPTVPAPEREEGALALPAGPRWPCGFPSPHRRRNHGHLLSWSPFPPPRPPPFSTRVLTLWLCIKWFWNWKKKKKERKREKKKSSFVKMSRRREQFTWKVSGQLLGCVQLFATPWTSAC